MIPNVGYVENLEKVRFYLNVGACQTGLAEEWRSDYCSHVLPSVSIIQKNFRSFTLSIRSRKINSEDRNFCAQLFQCLLRFLDSSSQYFQGLGGQQDSYEEECRLQGCLSSSLATVHNYFAHDIENIVGKKLYFSLSQILLRS